jgi:hypothetical protein
MRNETIMIPFSEKRKFDMKCDYKMLYKMAFRDEAIIAVLCNKYYMTQGTVKNYLQPITQLRREAREELRKNPLPVEYH